MSHIKKRRLTPPIYPSRAHRPLNARRTGFIINFKCHKRGFKGYSNLDTWINDLFDYVHLKDDRIEKCDVCNWVKLYPWITAEFKARPTTGNRVTRSGVHEAIRPPNEAESSRIIKPGPVSQIHAIPTTSENDTQVSSISTTSAPSTSVQDTQKPDPGTSKSFMLPSSNAGAASASNSLASPQTSIRLISVGRIQASIPASTSAPGNSVEDNQEPGTSKSCMLTSTPTTTDVPTPNPLPASASAPATQVSPNNSSTENNQDTQKEDGQQQHNKDAELALEGLGLINILGELCESLEMPLVQLELQPLWGTFQRRCNHSFFRQSSEPSNFNGMAFNVKQEHNVEE